MLNDNVPVKSRDLSRDEQYIYDICKAVSTGECSSDLANKSPGKLSHARWVTTANRLLQLYVSTESPSDILKELATFVVRVYTRHGIIKSNSKITGKAVNLWKTIRFSPYLSEDRKEVIQKVFQENGYFAHLENILIAMLKDEREHIRKLAALRIIAVRECGNVDEGNRRFEIPAIHFDASDYADMISWSDIAVTEPPSTGHLSNNDQQRLLNERVDIAIEEVLVELQNHTQAVERAVK